MIGRAVGWFFSTSRDAVARGLVRVGVTPNALTMLGMAFTIGAGVCYALGAGAAFGWSPCAGDAGTCSAEAGRPPAAGPFLLLAAAMIILASACDMLDGAVARIGGKSTKFGAFLDSTLDRFSDFAVYAGIAVYYAAQRPANVTFVLLSMVAFFTSFMISYTRARAEDLIDDCHVGYWQRGERSAAILIATFAHNIPALILQQATLPLFTVFRRVAWTHAVINGRKPAADPRQGPWHVRLRLWRWPRMTWAYDLVTAVNIAWLIAAPKWMTTFDPIGAAMR
jgi:CDP-diacylglycerol--glycerol-3-phosphate 3-phosphatidyltransferase